jgi:AcrR family transcriptional regulator
MARDPLLDTLFRPTAPPPTVQVTAGDTLASAEPIRQSGTRVRAGNAMSRTRAALLAGARRAVEANGTRITMAQVASAADVAKATLYNHFRTREAVLDALLQAEVRAVVDRYAEQPLAEALTGVAHRLSTDPAVRALAAREPGALAALARVDLDRPGWQTARSALDAALADAGRGGTDTVLRWLASFLTTPGAPAAIAADVAVLLAGLPPAAGQPVDDPLRATALPDAARATA